MPKTEAEPSEVDMSSLGYVRNTRKATTRDASPHVTADDKSSSPGAPPLLGRSGSSMESVESRKSILKNPQKTLKKQKQKTVQINEETSTETLEQKALRNYESHFELAVGSASLE